MALPHYHSSKRLTSEELTAKAQTLPTQAISTEVTRASKGTEFYTAKLSTVPETQQKGKWSKYHQATYIPDLEFQIAPTPLVNVAT